jgi:hypothetical protein
VTEAEWLACGDPRAMFHWLCLSRRSDRHRLGQLFVACCDLIPPSVAGGSPMPEGHHWTDDDSRQIALTDAEFHLSEAVREAMRAIGSGESEQAALVALIRDIFGNPFRPPVEFFPEWRTDTVIAIARTMYASRDFSGMPILADALQDAGCDSEDILTHCRGGGPHVRGCWVVDLVLEKE